MGLFDAEGQSHNTVYALHRFMLGIYCINVSRSRKGKRVLPNPWHKRLRHINNLRKRRGYTIMLGSQSDLQSRDFGLLFLMHQSIPAAPSPPSPGATAGHLEILCCPGVRAFANAGGHSRAFDTHAVSYQNITMRRILLGKKEDLLICQGHE